MSDDPKLPKANPIDPNVEEEWKAPSRSLDTDGQVVGIKPSAPPAPPPNAPVLADRDGNLPLAALTTGDLELARDPTVRPASNYEEPIYRTEDIHIRSRKKPIIVMIVLVVAAVGGFFALYKSPRATATLNAFTPKGPLVISSEPSPAELWIGGKKVGNTPWAEDNRYVGKTSYEIRAKGYKTKKGTFRGGEETHLSIELEKE